MPLRIAAALLLSICGCVQCAHSQITPKHPTVVEKDAPVLGFTLHYAEAGGGPTVILLHGLGSDGSRWAPNIVPLAHGFHVIALDQIGFGKSDKPLANYNVSMLSEFLVRFMSSLGVSKASLVGNSMGASVALYTAVYHPEFVDRIVLADGGDFRRDTAVPPPQRDPHVRQILNGATLDETRELMRLLYHNKNLATDQVVEENLTMRLRSSYTIGKVLDAGDKGIAGLSEEQVRALRIPTLILWGKYDELANPQGADRLANAIPGSQKILIDDAGHMPQLEKSEEFNRLVVEFLSK